MGCNGNTPIRSWNDWPHQCPTDIRDIISYIKIDSTIGEYKNSDTFKPSGETWNTNTVTYGTNASLKANRSDDNQMNAEATQWNTQSKSLPDDPDIPPALKKVAFIRSGEEWYTTIEIDFGGTTYTDIEISFRNNAATRGDAQGTIPVYSFTGTTWTGTKTLYVTLKHPGDFILGMRLIDDSSNYYFCEMEWIGV